MSTEFVNKVTLSINSQEITDFSSFTENEISLHARVSLMNKDGVSSKTARYGVALDYVVPKGPQFDFDSVKGATIRVDEDGGEALLFTGVYIETKGEKKVDEATDSVIRTMTFICLGRQVI